MMRRLPIIATIIVVAAVATMIMLGFWQLDRGNQKAALLESYKAASVNNAPVQFPLTEEQASAVLYRQSRIDCTSPTPTSAVAGRNAEGTVGWAVTARCGGENGPLVVLGWSQEPIEKPWAGGVVTGVVALGPRLVSDTPIPGLQANAKPDPAELPDNHLAYAGQWFLFAAAAAVIYALAVRKRLKAV